MKHGDKTQPLSHELWSAWLKEKAATRSRFEDFSPIDTPSRFARARRFALGLLRFLGKTLAVVGALHFLALVGTAALLAEIELLDTHGAAVGQWMSDYVAPVVIRFLEVVFG